MNKKFLAKDTGETILEHSGMVLKFALEIAKKMGIKDEKILESLKYSALLHDIGKIHEDFQKILRNETKSSNYKYRHNEIAWAVLTKYLKLLC